MFLSADVINAMTAEQVKVLDLSLYSTISKLEVEKMEIASFHKNTILTKIDANQMKEGSHKTPNSREYIDNNGEYRLYIPLNELRARIEEKGKRHISDDFKLGKRAWVIIMDKIGFSYVENNQYLPFDDIDDCFKATNPTSGQKGFNLECIDKFWTDYAEQMLRIKSIVDASLEEEKALKDARRQEDAKLERKRKRELEQI